MECPGCHVYLEIFVSVLVVSSHHARDEAAVIGLLVPGHHEDPDPLAGLPLEQLPHVGVAVHRGLLAPDQADASEHTPASDVDQLRGL